MAKKIEELDRNFAAAKPVGEYVYRSVWEIPALEIEGLHPGTFCRMDPAVLPLMSEGVQELAWHTSGGAVRFRANGKRFGFRMELRSGGDMSHMPRTGISGLDIYLGSGEGCRFRQSTQPACGATLAEGECLLPEGGEEVTLYLPLYNGLNRLELGFCPGEEPLAPAAHRLEQPVLFYGSSITQGGCASRPGNAYAAMLGRMLDCPIRNLGFSGNGKGEREMADYIASLPMAALVLDYDHNAPSPEYLQKTHLPFLQRILESHPDLPVLFASKPDFGRTSAAEDAQRREVVRASYDWMKDQGLRTDFLDGERLFDGPMADSCTVDGCHPNDLGFYRMAMAMYPLLKELLEG